ncbi:MAG: hypothetical protein J0I29_07905 [Rhizobiales bacterium]|nr:hypothetical protein [Hyphomicrobiales bacterium]
MRFAWMAVLSAALSGCATVPTQQADHVSIAAVEKRIKCEIGAAYRKISQAHNAPSLKLWAAAVTLTLAVDETGGVTPSSSLTGPYGSLSPLELNANLSLNSKRTALLNIYLSFDEAGNYYCDDFAILPIEGRLGLSDWIIRVFEAQRTVELDAESGAEKLKTYDFISTDKSIGYSLDFLLTASVGATPNFIIPNTGTAKGVISFESKSTHSLDIAMIEMSKGDYGKHFVPVHVPKRTVPVVRKNKFGVLIFEGEKTIDAHTENRSVVDVGPGAKLRLNDILNQLNNRVLIQSLRR